MKNLPVLLILLSFYSCHQATSKKIDAPITDTTAAKKIVEMTPDTLADIDTPKAPEMVMLSNRRGDLAVFCVYGAELVTVVPAEKHGFEELMANPQALQDMAARSHQKMSDSNDIAHAIWASELREDSVIIMKTPMAKGSVEVVYTFKDDTLSAASTIRRQGRAMTITTKQMWNAGTGKFNEMRTTIQQHLMGLVNR